MPGEARRPNILMIMADQLSALATSPYGNTYAQTPHLQELAGPGSSAPPTPTRTIRR